MPMVIPVHGIFVRGVVGGLWGRFGPWRGGYRRKGFDFLALPLAAKGEILRAKSGLNWPSFVTRVIKQY